MNTTKQTTVPAAGTRVEYSRGLAKPFAGVVVAGGCEDEACGAVHVKADGAGNLHHVPRALFLAPEPRAWARPLAALAIILALGLSACRATAPVAAPPETVGTLSPSYRSIATAPVAPSTDFAAPVVIETDDGPSSEVEKQEVEAPEVVSKGGGITTVAR